MNHTPRSRIRHLLGLSLAAAILVASSAFAGITADKAIVKETMGVDGIHWQSQGNYQSANLVVTGPGGFRWEQSFESGESLFLDFKALTEAYSPSGPYKYELRFTPRVSAADRALAQEAREFGDEVDFLAHYAIPAVSGGFMIDGGLVVDRGLVEAGSMKTVHLMDTFIIGSLCVGIDCPSGGGGGFGFDTIRLQENNLRIKFQDTSTSASFPTNDWQITANESSNGGLEKFSIDDVTGGRTPFTIEAGAPSHSLYVDDGGRLGLGTSQPVVDVHVVSGNTPTLRLEQNGSSGFTPQTWDVAGNEAGFFVRDATSGSTLPFRIRPGAQSSAIDVSADSKTTMNAESVGGRDVLRLKRGGNVGVVMEDTSATAVEWSIGTASDGDFNIALTGAGVLLEVTQAGDLFVNGMMMNVPDYVFEDGYRLMSLTELAAFIDSNGHLPGVTSAEEVAKAGGVNIVRSQMQLLEKIEELTLYTLRLNARIDELTSRPEAR